MIILDTNVLSELMKSQPDKLVVRWIGRHQATSLFITTLTQAEILYGLEILLIIKMLRIRYSNRELDIEGSIQDYVMFRSRLNKVICEQNISSIELICDTEFDPSPYEKKCKKIQIQIGSGLNKFIVSGSTLKVEGSSVALKNFSNNFPDRCAKHDKLIGYHHHYDVCSFPEYISSDSPEVVLSLRQ